MKVCIPAESPSLDAAVDPRLARAECFVLVDSDSRQMLTSIPNKQNKLVAAGAGVQATQTIAKSGAEAVVCANAGPNAFRVLQAAGVSVYTGAAGTVAEALTAFLDGKLELADQANVQGHW